MKALLSLLGLLLLAGPLAAQVDVVDRRGAPSLEGTLIGYRYGEDVSLLQDDGDVVVVPWTEVRRVFFQQAPTPVVELPANQPYWVYDTLVDVPRRKWRHQLTFTTGFSKETDADFFGNSVTSAVLAPGIHYHFLRRIARFGAGIGGGFESMNRRRGERMASLTAQLEYHPGRGRIRPLLRINGGASLPVGSDLTAMRSRSVGYLVHPAVGILLGAPRGRFVDLAFDLGYRFSSLTFTADSPNFEVIERNVIYRRLSFGITGRF